MRADQASVQVPERRPDPAPGPRTYRLVIFDFDGTLADTYDWFAGVINGVADRYRFRRIEAHEAERLRGMDARAVVRHLGIPAWKLPFITRHMHALAARDADAVRLFPGIVDMLAELSDAGVALAIVSSNTEANIRQVLGPQAGLIRRYACGASLFGKAERLRATIRAARLRPEAALAVGDEIRDLDAAREAACGFAAVGWGYTRLEALAARGPDLLFDAPKQVAPALLRGRRPDHMPRLAPGTTDGPLPNGS